ncbi:hypothetical protein HDU85_004460 [Gaertneriomyces sp. JEL0708]|nr:hypothetical protein HDU85_004460 [Gaertneriomyces sp. JEL0708]
MTTGKAEAIAVLYASQTGNAEWIAKHIHEEALARGYASTCHTLDDHADANLSENKALVVVASTTGDGDPPDNATKFWRWLRRAKGKDAEVFTGKKYALLGLGDTNYSNFCNTAKRLDRKLTEMGAIPLMPKSFADDATGLEAVVDPWVDAFWQALPSTVEYDEEKAASFSEQAQKAKRKLKLGSLSSSNDEKGTEQGDAPSTTATTESVVNQTGSGPVSVSQSVDSSDKSTTEAFDDRSAVGNSLAESVQSDPHQGSDLLHYEPTAIVIPSISANQLTNVAKIPAQFLEVINEDSQRAISTSQVTPFHSSKRKSSPFDYNAGSPFLAPLKSARCLTGAKALKRVIEIELDIEGLHWDYVPGDAFGVVCPNPDALVVPLLKRLHQNPTQVFSLKAKEAAGLEGFAYPADMRYSTYECFKYLLDLHSLPKKGFFRMLAEHSTDTDEKKILYYLASTQGAATYRSLRLQSPTLLDILHTFPACQPPLARLLENLPRLQPRYYSVATSPLANEKSLAFAFNITEYVTAEPYRKSVQGLCTTWLDQMVGSPMDSGYIMPGDAMLAIPIFPKPSPGESAAFTLPKDSAAPIIMIAAGTGITPFVSFLSHRHLQKKSASDNTLFGSAWLFHGRRFAGADGDAIYENEIERFVEDGTLSEFVACLSRETPCENQTIYKYVQDGLRAMGASLAKLIADGAYIYVCGSIAMAKEVDQALAEVLVTHAGSSDKAAAIDELGVLRNKGRYSKEIWT